MPGAAITCHQSALRSPTDKTKPKPNQKQIKIPSKMFKYAVVICALIACVAAKPGLLHAPLAAPLFAAPAPVVTAASSQVVARTFNGIATAPVIAQVPVAPAPVPVPVVRTVAAPFAAPLAAPLPAPIVRAAPFAAQYAAPFGTPFAAPLAAPYTAPFAHPYGAPVIAKYSAPLAYAPAPLNYAAAPALW
ncbi:Hypothetical predicted protein [Drosophila guanche]|uniref:Uncharacterized protein n=2 Tax=Drosophila guanche TaxID=7266 RepID=A0A3B0J9G8_DROGU|nr:Hypothetical predicted protein [Drosophila guanche]